MDKIASLATDIAKLVAVRGARGLAGAGIGAATTYGLNKATGTDEWANSLSQEAQYSTMAGLGALAAQPGAGRMLSKYLFPRRQVGGTGFVSDLLRPGAKRAPIMSRDFSPLRALSLASLPAAAYKIPLLAGAASTPMSKTLTVDLPNEYAKELALNGKSPEDYNFGSFLLERVGKGAVTKGEPVAREMMDKALGVLQPALEKQRDALTAAAKTTATELGNKAWSDTKPYVIEAVKNTAAPLAGSLAGSGLGWMLGNAFYRDDKSLTAEERMARAEKQNMAKVLLSVLGGSVGTLAPSAPDLWDMAKKKF